MFGELEGGETPGRGGAEQNWGKCLADDFKAFEAERESTNDEPRVFGVPGACWMEAARVRGGASWHAGVVKGAERFMTTWHQDEEEASRQRATKRDNKTRSIEEAKTKGAGKGQRKDETAKEESKRELADRVARHVAD